MSRHPNQQRNYGRPLNDKPPAQDTSRHTPRAAASHLSPAELTKRDASMVETDAEALERVQKTRPLKPPGRRT